MTAQQLSAELMATVPRLDFSGALTFLNRSFKDVRERRLWSWLVGEGTLVAPQVVSAGTVTVTQYSPTVQLDATANAALNAANVPLLTTRQFRANMGPIYNITGYSNGSATLTLDAIYGEASAAGAPYQVYKCYFQPMDLLGNLVTDFLMFIAVLNPVDGYAVIGPNLRVTKPELDARDPTRSDQDLLYVLATYKADASGNPIYEAWPHPTSQRLYRTLYQRRGVELNPADVLPATLSKDLVVEHAKPFAYDWAIANSGRFPELQGVNWALLTSEARRRYERMMADAERNDDNIFLRDFLPQLRDYLTFPPLDAKFAQSHDMGGWFQGDGW